MTWSRFSIFSWVPESGFSLVRSVSFGVLAFIAAANAVAAEISEKQAEKLLKVSGYWQGVENLLQMFQRDIYLERLTAPDEALDEHEIKIYLRGLKFEFFRLRLVDAVRKGLSAAEVRALTAAYSQAAVANIIAAERNGGAGIERGEQAAYLDMLARKPIDRKRRDLLRRLDDASFITDRSIHLTVTMARARARSILEFRDKWDEQSQQKLEYGMNRLRDSLTQNTWKQVLLRIYYLYRDISDDDLERYIGLLEDQQHKKMTLLLADAIADVVAGGVRQGMKSLLDYRAKSET